MEIPQTGRAIITEGFDNTQVIIPAKKNYLMMIMPFIAIVVFFEMIGPRFLKDFPVWQSGTGLFPWFCVIWVSVILLSGLRLTWWNIAGKEVIEAGQGVLSIKRKGDWFARTRSYDLSEARYFRAEETDGGQYNNHLANFGRANNRMGTVCFEYGAKTIRFGDGLSQAEGNYILQKLRDKKVLTDKNL